MELYHRRADGSLGRVRLCRLLLALLTTTTLAAALGAAATAM